MFRKWLKVLRVILPPALLVTSGLVGLVLSPSPVHAASRTATTSGNWSNTTTWNGQAIPTSADDVTINADVTVTVDVALAQCASINVLASNNSYSAITLSSGKRLTIGGAVTINAATNNNQISLAVGAGTLDAASVTLAGSTGNANQRCALTVSTGTINISGNITFTGLSGSPRLTFSGAGTLNLGGNLVSGGTFTASTGTVNCNGSSAQTVAGYTYNVLKSNNTAGVTLGGASTIKTLTIGDVTPNSLFNDGGFVITPGASSVLNLTSGTYNLGSATVGTAWPAWGTRNIVAGTTVGYVSGIAQTISVVPSYKNLAYSGAGTKTVAAGGTLSVAGNFSTTGGTATFTTTANATVTGIISGNGAITMGSGTLTVSGDWTNNGTFTKGTSTVTYNGGSAQTLAGLSYNNLTTSGAGAKNAAGNVTIGATLTNGSTLDMAGYTLTLGTTTNNNSTVRFSGATNGKPVGTAGTVEYYGTGQTVATGTYNSLTINQSSGNATLGSDATVNGILTLTNGNLIVTDPKILTMSASATTVGVTDVIGIVKRTTLIAGTSYTFGNQFTTLTFASTGTLPSDVSIKISIGSAPAWKQGPTPPAAITRYYDIIRTGGSGIRVTFDAHYLHSEFNGNTESQLVFWDYHADEGGLVEEHGKTNIDTTNNWVGFANVPIEYLPTSFGVHQWTLADFVSSATTNKWLGTYSADWATGTNWSQAHPPTGTEDVIIPDAATTVNDPMLPAGATASTLNLQAGAILNSGASSVLTIAGPTGDIVGAWTNDGGVFYPSMGTVIFTGSTATISGTTTFYNLTIASGGDLTVGTGAIIGIVGVMTNSGTWRSATLPNTIEYKGAGQTVLNPNGGIPGYYNLILSGTGTKTMPGSALSVMGDFSMSGIASATAGAAMTIGGNFTLGSGTTFTTGALSHSIAGNFSNNGGTFTATGSTVTLNGSAAQTINGTTSTAFNNLTISNTSALVSASTNFSVVGTLTVGAGAVLNPAAAVVISGAGAMTGSGTVNVTRTSATADFSSQYTINKTLTDLTVAYVGSAAQTISALTYGGLSINNANGVTLGGNATVGGVLALINGKITTGANAVIISSTGSVSGGSSSSYVIGNLQKWVATTTTLINFEVGEVADYDPVLVTFTSVSVAGNLTAKVTNGEHPNIATSTINRNKNVNDYWTLTNSSITFTTYSATFTFATGDIDSGADTSRFIVGKYSAGWTYPTVGARTSTSTEVTGVLLAASFGEFDIGEPLGTWASYSDSGHSTGCDPFADYASQHTIYMYGTGYAASTAYRVIFWDSAGANVVTLDGYSDGSGTLAALHILVDTDATGDWHCAVYDSTDYSPVSYSATDIHIVGDDTSYTGGAALNVAASAIPEFPTVLSGIAVAGACAAIYWWMRKREMAHVKA